MARFGIGGGTGRRAAAGVVLGSLIASARRDCVWHEPKQMTSVRARTFMMLSALMRRASHSRLTHNMRNRASLLAPRCLILLALAFVVTGCATKPPRVGMQVPRKGDEIMVAGQLFHTGAPVVLWTDPGGYDAYRTEKRFVPWEKAAYVPGA